MKAFDGRRHRHRAFGKSAASGKPRRGKNKAGPQPLATIHRGISHRSGKSVGRPVHIVKQCAEIPLDGRRVVTHGLRKRHELLVGTEGIG